MLDEHTTRKLNLYLEKTTKGFFLLTVNDWTLQKQLKNLIVNKVQAVEFDLGNCHLRSFLEEFQENERKQGIIFWNSEWKETEIDAIYEKINIARDFLQQMKCFIIFLAPEYVSEHIRFEYPNLYSYCVLKEKYLQDYPLFLDYLLPGKDYLTTKEIQHFLKHSFQQDNEFAWEKMDYLLRVKVSGEEIIQIIEQFRNHLKKIDLASADYDLRYFYQLHLLIAKVFVKQEYFQLAHRAYMDFIKRQDNPYEDLFYEALLGNADVWIYEKEYEKALSFYKTLLAQIVSQYEEQEETQYHNYRYQIYLRIAACHIEKKEYLKAYDYLKALQDVKEARKDIGVDDLFVGNYNYVLLLLKLKRYDECQTAIEILEQMPRNSVQEAMYLCIKSYYEGVVCGKLFEAAKLSMQALDIKRKIFIENDIRIAESHYVNSRLYLMCGKYEKAQHCCKKSENILKNFPQKSDLKNIVNELKIEISSLKKS